MRIVFDFRFTPGGDLPDGELVTLGDVAKLLRSPRRLACLYFGRRWDEAVVVHDGLPGSGVALPLALVRARRFEVRAGERVSRRSLPGFVALAVARCALELPAEVARTLAQVRRLRRVIDGSGCLPAAHGALRRVAYLRVDPTITWLGAHVGGAATHTTGVINGLGANGLEVAVYAPEQPDGAEAATFTRVPLQRVYNAMRWLTVTGYGEGATRVAAADAHPDFVYQRYTLGSYAGLALADRLAVPLVLEFNGSEVWADKHWGHGELRNVELLSALEWRNVRAASLVVVVSDVLAEQLADEGIDSARILVNPNGVDVDRLARLREAPPAQWRRGAGLPEAPTVGFIGTFGLWHGVLVLPEIIERVAAELPGARWVLVGAGQFFEQVRDDLAARGLAERVHMPGVVPHEKAVELLAASDVCVSPHVPNPDGSRFFGSPTKLFEYMGLGKPIVASDLEQIGEVIEHEKTGLLCPPADAAAAAAAVVRLLGDPKLRKRLGAAALERAGTTYSWKAHTQRILDALSA